MIKMTKPEPRDGKIFDEGRYQAKRQADNTLVTGILVRDEITGEIEGILNEENDYTELAWIFDSTLVKIDNEIDGNEPVIDYLVIAVDGITAEVTTFKASMTQSAAIAAMKEVIDGEPDVYENGMLWIQIDCIDQMEFNMLTDTYIKCIPIDKMEYGKISDLHF